tara:strand:- start:1386 stop:1490 length:105 start_codon:yes stop_codon:yes gene_type:complete
MNETIKTRHGEAMPFCIIENANGQMEIILELIHQ